jgi:hypothetical protein
MKVTIEAGSPSEVAQLLQFIETMNLGSLQLVVNKTPILGRNTWLSMAFTPCG